MSVLDGSFKEIKLINRIETADELGGFFISYKTSQTFNGLIARTGTSESSVASQKPITESYILMTKDNDVIIGPGDVLQGFDKTCIVSSNELRGSSLSPLMRDIRQWECKSYDIPKGVVIE